MKGCSPSDAYHPPTHPPTQHLFLRRNSRILWFSCTPACPENSGRISKERIDETKLNDLKLNDFNELAAERRTKRREDHRIPAGSGGWLECGCTHPPPSDVPLHHSHCIATFLLRSSSSSSSSSCSPYSDPPPPPLRPI